MAYALPLPAQAQTLISEMGRQWAAIDYLNTHNGTPSARCIKGVRFDRAPGRFYTQVRDQANHIRVHVPIYGDCEHCHGQRAPCWFCPVRHTCRRMPSFAWETDRDTNF